MKDQFVTYEIAKKLKELGFNEPCLSAYTYDGFRYDVLTVISESENVVKGRLNKNCDNYTYSAPLWQQVIDWLRHTKNIQIYVESSTKNMAGYWVDWVYSVNLNTLDSRDGLDTYEEAREKGILKALELITK